MFKPKPMRASDYTCLVCGSRLELKFQNLKIGDNFGCCPMCNESFNVNITKKEMEELLEAEEH